MRKGHLNFHISVENQHLRSPKINHQNTVVSARKHDSPLIEIAQEFACLGQKNRTTCPQRYQWTKCQKIKRECMSSVKCIHLKLIAIVMKLKQTINHTSVYIIYDTYILSRDPLTLQIKYRNLSNVEVKEMFPNKEMAGSWNLFLTKCRFWCVFQTWRHHC